MRYVGQLEERLAAAYLMGNGQRDYCPSLMRFSAPDPLGPFITGELNSYAYCEAEPINNVDTSGLSGISSIFKGLKNLRGRRFRSKDLILAHKQATANKKILKNNLLQSGVPATFSETARTQIAQLQRSRAFRHVNIFSNFDVNKPLPTYRPDMAPEDMFSISQAQLQYDRLDQLTQYAKKKLVSRNKIHLLDPPPNYADFALPTYEEAMKTLRKGSRRTSRFIE